MNLEEKVTRLRAEIKRALGVLSGMQPPTDSVQTVRGLDFCWLEGRLHLKGKSGWCKVKIDPPNIPDLPNDLGFLLDVGEALMKIHKKCKGRDEELLNRSEKMISDLAAVH